MTKFQDFSRLEKLSPFFQVFQELWEPWAQSGSPEAVVTVAEDMDLNLSDMKSFLDTTIRLLGMANVQLVQKRRLDLHPSIQPQFKSLCTNAHPFNHLMFGSSVKTSVDDVTKLNKIANTVTSTPKSKKQQFKGYNPYFAQQCFLGKRGGGAGKCGGHQQGAHQ